ncbi:hypothetical protein O3P69_013868 [Scylla paramamosain]|uniref:Uncharacterized protein n=1 Tax=Scylla paramamosain TaxID=85552 RepID=A0AAW0STH5_SCYPA
MYNLRDAHPRSPPRREDQPPPHFLWPCCTSPSLSVIQCGLRRALRWRWLLKDSEFCQVCAACQGPGRAWSPSLCMFSLLRLQCRPLVRVRPTLPCIRGLAHHFNLELCDVTHRGATSVRHGVGGRWLVSLGKFSRRLPATRRTEVFHNPTASSCLVVLEELGTEIYHREVEARHSAKQEVVEQHRNYCYSETSTLPSP